MTITEQTDTQLFLPALEQAFLTIRRTAPKMAGQFPNLGQAALTYSRSNDHNWVEGFWTGQLWLGYAHTGDDFFFQAARATRPYYQERLTRPATLDHDLGFLYVLSQVADYKLTGDGATREMALQAADLLAARYNPHGKFLLAWNDWPNDTPELQVRRRGKIIIDCMENLSLLFWAAQQTGQTDYYDRAVDHATTSARYLVRKDGSTYHSFDFNPQTGEPIEGVTVQGFADESCWSRGQSWGIHGFALAYAYTGQTLFRDTACRLADYAIERLPSDNVPYWDYQLPADAPHYRDTSAASIGAAGLFLLADLLDNDPTKATRYRQTAQAILTGLIQDYTTADAPQAEGLLREGCPFVKVGLPDNMLPYGDYFFVESLLRALGRQDFFW